MWCHTRVQGLASVPEIQVGGCFEPESGKKRGKPGPSQRAIFEWAGSEKWDAVAKREVGVGATSERAIGRGGWNRGCATPYGTALYRTWGQGNQPSGLCPGSAKGPSDGRLQSHDSPPRRWGCLDCHRVWGDGIGLGMVREGDTRGGSPHGACLSGGCCDVMGVYRDLRQLQKCKSGWFAT